MIPIIKLKTLTPKSRKRVARKLMYEIAIIRAVIDSTYRDIEEGYADPEDIEYWNEEIRRIGEAWN